MLTLSAAFASSIACFCVLKEPASITAPMKFSKSATSPILIVLTSSTRRSLISGQRLEGAKTREAAEHFWPWYSKLPRTIAVATAARSEDTSELQSNHDLV